MATIALVHTGPRFPEYLTDCVHQANKFGHAVILACDDLSRCGNIPCDTISCGELVDSSYVRFLESTKLDKSSMGGFWARASSRFFILRRLIDKLGLKDTIHIENDVLLYSRLDNIPSVVKSEQKKVALVMDCPSRCVPSLVYFKDADCCSELTEHMLSNVGMNDMQSLALFFNSRRNEVFNLPIVPKSLDRWSTKNIQYSNKSQELGEVFDGAAIGQFMGGIDPIHNKGDTVGFINETSVFKASDLRYRWVDGCPFVEDGDSLIRIANLHIHSKNLRRHMR